jgi:hypothetical protein
MIIKKVIILVLFFTWGVALQGQSMDLENIRTNYVKAVSDKKLCLTMMNELGTETQSSLHLVYLGAFQTIWAKHVTNPISKLRTFSRGKKNIDEAVIADPNNIEIRLVRLSVQINSPAFLGYRNNIDEDKKFIQANNKNITSAVLREVMAVLI